MSHAANLYVKKLKAAPTGEAIQASERALLWYLADCHSEEAGGIAWPSMMTLADHLGLSQRQARRLVKGVEDKGIIGRVQQVRDNGSSAANNYYFIALGYEPTTGNTLRKTRGKGTKKGGKPVGKVAKEEGGTRTSMTGGVGHPLPGDPDIDDRETRTPVPSLEASIETPVETPLESAAPPCPPLGGDDDGGSISQEQNTSKTKTARPNISSATDQTPNSNPVSDPPHRGKWDDFKADLERQIDRLPEKIREGAMGAFAAIRDTTLIGEGCDGDTIEPTWTISATEPQVTHNALQFLWPQVKSALWKAAKGNVVLKVYGGGE